MLKILHYINGKFQLSNLNIQKVNTDDLLRRVTSPRAPSETCNGGHSMRHMLQKENQFIIIDY